VSLDTTALLVRDVICGTGRGCERPIVITIITKEANIPYILAGRLDPTSHLPTRAYFDLLISAILKCVCMKGILTIAFLKYNF
jgi:hypothetical protein